jgi:hypothetical protein
MSHSSGDPVPSIPEDRATGEIAGLYDDIRRSLGVSVVNLIWRNLAATPGALAWAWGGVKPLYSRGAIQAEAQALREGQRLPACPVLPPSVLRAAGVSKPDQTAIRNVIAAYDRSNALNLLALLTLLGRLRGEAAVAAETQSSVDAVEGEPPQESKLPPILPLDGMEPETAALVREINRLGARGQEHILVSMPRHLAHWPGYLALYWMLIAPFDADGRLGACIDAVFADGQRRAAGLLTYMGATVPPDAAIRDAVEHTLEDFARNAISRMIPITALLLAALPG